MTENRLDRCFKSLAEEQKKALVTYVVNGDPSEDLTLKAMHAMVEAGANVLELGVPFSDPMAEGPVIQKGHERALAQGASLRSTLQLTEEFRKTDDKTPIVLMGYANPVERMGYVTFAERAAKAGVDGLITVDLPPEEGEALHKELRTRNINSIFLIAPTSSDERIQRVSEVAGGFIYYVSLKGVTGASHLDVASVEANIARIRRHSSLPLAVGFGIKDAESASQVGAIADAVVVGSALVEILSAATSESETLSALTSKIASIREALDKL